MTGMMCSSLAIGRATPRARSSAWPRNSYVIFDGQGYDIRVQVHTLGGYSAHADQKGLVSFVTR